MGIMKKMKDFQWVLASQSPRRKFLLEGLGWVLDVRPTNVNETPVEGESASACARRLAEAKVRACVWNHGEIIVGADTLVALEQELLGKPRDEGHAIEMLQRLSGRSHEVISGVAVRKGELVISDVELTRVSFRDLSQEEIVAYVSTGEPLDKAGAYGIQGHGGALVAEIRGDYPNVVGLPIAKLNFMIKQLGVN